MSMFARVPESGFTTAGSNLITTAALALFCSRTSSESWPENIAESFQSSLANVVSLNSALRLARGATLRARGKPSLPKKIGQKISHTASV
jgi:hypothetical protein